MTWLPPTEPLTRWDRFNVSGVAVSYVISDSWNVLLDKPGSRNEIVLKFGPMYLSGPAYFGFTGGEAVTFGRLLLKIVESIAGQDRIADVPSHWLDGFHINPGNVVEPSLFDRLLAMLSRSPSGEQRIYRLPRHRKLVALPNSGGGQLVLVQQGGDVTDYPIGLTDAERIGRTILGLLGNRPEYRLVPEI